MYLAASWRIRVGKLSDTLLAAVELTGLAVNTFSMSEVLLVAELAVEG